MSENIDLGKVYPISEIFTSDPGRGRFGRHADDVRAAGRLLRRHAAGRLGAL